MNFRDIVLVKPRVKDSTAFKVMLNSIKVGDVIECFFPKIGNEYSYLGYATYTYTVGSKFLYPEEALLREFFKEVDKLSLIHI